MTTESTLALARFVAYTKPHEMTERVRREAKRAILNWLGCAIGASHHDTVERAIAALAPFAGPPQATVLGRHERFDIFHAALLNGMTSHTFDFDDTHLRTIIHPTGPVASALLALAEHTPVSGDAFIHAFVLGTEVECRIGNAVYPSHYDVGWHITGTAGVFGAAAAVGRLLGLTEQQLVWALGIAATQASGLREMFGSMCKPLHVGLAARNGLQAALLAKQDFTSAAQPIEGRRGFANVLATERDLSKITDRLGETWELEANSYKPFACGVVVHPAIDGCLQLRTEEGLAAASIEVIELRVHPLVLELTGKKAPRTGLEGKFSVYHSAAVAIIDGAAGPAQYSDAHVADPAVIALRDRVRATVDPALSEDAAHIRIRLSDGRIHERFVAHALGSIENPMSDGDLEAKFRGLCAPILSEDATQAIIAACRRFDTSTDAGALARLTVSQHRTADATAARA
ncbi:MAG: MmgE/PrpD family protein [Betaproteobacteria bacterium]|nr:MAG: MmgE/PrpD family protein [Betaproteobacteria bacterium]